jgi:hypothetical protein
MNARFVVIPSFKKKRTNTMKKGPLWLIRKRNNDFAAFFSDLCSFMQYWLHQTQRRQKIISL